MPEVSTRRLFTREHAIRYFGPTVVKEDVTINADRAGGTWINQADGDVLVTLPQGASQGQDFTFFVDQPRFLGVRAARGTMRCSAGDALRTLPAGAVVCSNTPGDRITFTCTGRDANDVPHFTAIRAESKGWKVAPTEAEKKAVTKPPTKTPTKTPAATGGKKK